MILQNKVKVVSQRTRTAFLIRKFNKNIYFSQKTYFLMKVFDHLVNKRFSFHSTMTLQQNNERKAAQF